MAKSLHDSIKTYLGTLHTKNFGRMFDLNQEKSLEACITWISNHYLKIKEEVDNDSFPTDEAIQAARHFNITTKSYLASARNDRVIVSMDPKVARVIANRVGGLDEN